MLIPSIDLQSGLVVQLVQGEDLALSSNDIDHWIQRFAAYPKVQVIDLDAAKGVGDNESLVRRICASLPCRVGGGIRSADRARTILEMGARKVIIGSALFRENGVDVDAAARFRDAVGASRLIGAVDSRGGRVVIHGWRTQLPISAVDAVRALEPYVGEFLYTHVDTEGLMQGTDIAAIRAVRAATQADVTAAGGITTREEIDQLHAIGVDSVVGMALYTNRLG
jgi:phosphoribosylformimino-5-aminoimidazole carboxamide ribotide isomerase